MQFPALNSEKQPYRWRPLTSSSRSAGLTDEAGYFWSTVPAVRKHAAPEAVEAELRAQIDAALDAGIDVTHLDGHMGAAMMPEFVDIYFRLGRDYNLPILLVKDSATLQSDDLRGLGLDRRSMMASLRKRARRAIRSSTSSSKPPGAGRPAPRRRIARCSRIFPKA